MKNEHCFSTSRQISLINPELTIESLAANFTGKGVQVAVIDSGIDAAHPALAGKIKRGCVVRVLEGDRIECKEVRAEESYDSFGHGTAVAGIIAEIAPDAEITSVKVLNEYNSCTANMLLEGLKWALEQKFPLINMSLAAREKFAQQLFRLCEQAYVQNSIIVTSRRNFGDLGCPAMFSSVISVDRGNFDNKYKYSFRPNNIIEYEARGTEVNVLAPKAGYACQTGSSFATPHITGIVALLLQAFPGMLGVEAKAALRSMHALDGQLSHRRPE